MLDTTTAPLPMMTPDWRDHIAVGDVVSFRFPCATDDTTPKARPCLVLDIETINGQRYALVAYGTTATTGANRGYEIRVSFTEALASAGLHKPTRFVVARRLLVPVESAGFACSAMTGAPVLGRLTGETRERMQAVRAHRLRRNFASEAAGRALPSVRPALEPSLFSKPGASQQLRRRRVGRASFGRSLSCCASRVRRSPRTTSKMFLPSAAERSDLFFASSWRILNSGTDP